ncbi:MAG: L,D-transpeptidase family protein [Microbacterium sp.]
MGNRTRARAVAAAVAGVLVASLLVVVAPGVASADGSVAGTAALADGGPVLADTTSDEGEATEASDEGEATEAGESADPTPTAEPVFVTATPKITGRIAVGATLTAKPGTWTSGTTFTYRWYANGTEIAKATKATYTLKKAQKSKRITVAVTGTHPDFSSVTETSAATLKVATVAKPKVAGFKWPGKTLRAKPGTWTAGTTFTYQWTLRGKPIAKATKSTIKVTKSMMGKGLRVVVTGHKAGYPTISKTSRVVKRLTRWIEIDLSRQLMVLHDKGKVVSKHLVSTGKAATPTKIGMFTIRAKLARQNMGNPNLSVWPYYYTRNVPWVMYFNGNQALHGAYWHNNFGHVMSHGCVNLPVKVAKKVYAWAKIGTLVFVHR